MIKHVIARNKVTKQSMISLALSAAFALSAHAQEDELSLQLNGFVDSYHALQLGSPYKVMSSRTRLRLEMRANYGEASLFSSVNLAYNSLIKEQSGAFLREAYFDYAGKYLEVKAGRQIVTWGVADGLRITDLISPMDYTEFMANDYDDIRVPVNAINLKYPGESFSAELVFVPVPEYFVMPSGEDNPWSMPVPEGVSMDLSGTPEKHIKNSEVGTRLRFFLENLDFSLTALRTFNKSPVTIADYDPETKSVVIQGIYKPMYVLGGDFSIPVSEFVVRGEMAGYFGEPIALNDSRRYRLRKTFNALFGLDWYAGDNWTFMVQYMHKIIMDYRKELGMDQNTSMVTARISKEVLNNTLKLSVYGMYDIDNVSFYIRPAADYLLNDQITLSLGADILGGRRGTFKTYEDNTQIWVKGKYFF
ncbi:DUF1302 family protein [Fibrobacter sp.]|uniref:DUF1302 family protein n=1 Tax=Fibrobacter sp. TaxID=35828 RepID=UPI0025BF686B|nr:DUF1302 family protein [Fibrobacter sp.]